MTTKQVKLGLIASGDGSNHWAWRDASIVPGSSIDIDYYRRLASAAESAMLDFLFLVDFSFVHPDSPPHMLNQFEPLTLLSALTATTSRIGLVATASTSFNEPFNLARQFSSLDILSEGRAGWNLVTSGQEEAAANFGAMKHQDHDLRYEIAEEHLHVVRGLWDSWEDDAFVYDTAEGIYYSSGKLHALNHTGRFFSVKGRRILAVIATAVGPSLRWVCESLAVSAGAH